jgi:hypothetical protein
MFYVLLAGFSAWAFNLCQAFGAREGLWRGWIYGMMLPPVWLAVAVLSVTLDLRGGAALAAMAAFALAPPTGAPPADAPRNRLLLSDVFIALLIVGQILSFHLSGDLRPMTSFEVVRKWLVPYLVGRLFLGCGADIGRVIPVFCTPALIMSGLAVVEALLKVNLINKALGKTYGLLEQGEGYRMGMKRAQGPMDHPIFFGMMLVLLLPWGIEAARRAGLVGGKRWWKYVPWAMGAALFCTVSRGPQFAGIVSGFATLFFVKPRWRVGLLALALVGGGGAYAGKHVVMELLGKMAGEEEEKKILPINGEDYEYSGTTHRVLLYKVYDQYIQTSGFFGFGAKLTGVVIEDERLAELFASIDNGYLLLYLQYGWVGLAGFVGLSLCNLYYLACVGWRLDRPEAPLAAAMFGAFLGVAAVMMSVWFAPDYAAVWCFASGVAANLRLLPVPSRVAPPYYQTRRLHPGYVALPSPLCEARS